MGGTPPHLFGNRQPLGRLLPQAEVIFEHRPTAGRYRSEKTVTEESWQHEEINLEPLNPDYDPIVIEGDPEERLTVIAELLEVLG